MQNYNEQNVKFLNKDWLSNSAMQSHIGVWGEREN